MNYSEIVNKVQGDKKKAKKLMIELIQEYDELEDIINEKRIELKNLQHKQDSFEANLHHIIKHIKLDYPVIINDTKNERQTVVTDDKVYHHYNVL